MNLGLKLPKLFLPLTAIAVSLPLQAAAQTATLQGRVTDPSGAVIPETAITATQAGQTLHTTSGPGGRYAFRSIEPGLYIVTATANGFAPLTLSEVTLAPNQVKELNLPLTIAAKQEEITVESQAQGVSLNPDQNASAMVLQGSDLDALSDDPTELPNELQALAGPAAGPNGGQIYVDGFEGGQLPPKSSILQVRVNQNPFSAEFDRIGYGRIEIITKPGSQKLKGSASGFGSSSAWNTANPLLTEQPSYYLYGYAINVSGPISKTASYFLSEQTFDRQIQAIVDAVNPANFAANFNEAFPTPVTYVALNPRVDFQITKNNFMSIRYFYHRNAAAGGGVGMLNLPDQATNSVAYANELQMHDTWIINPHLLMEPAFVWRRTSNHVTPSLTTPTVTVQGAFTNGGSNSGTTEDRQDIFTLQNYGTATVGRHALRFGARARSYRDANFSTAGVNGSYFFNSIAAYQSSTPAQYSATVISNPTARVLLFDGSLFAQDDWRVRPNFQLGLGLRFEGQNFIRNHADWAPRIAFAWSPGRPGNTPPKTIIRAGYGWFYNRFLLPSAFNNTDGAPYIIKAIHDNLINQKSYTIANPGFYNPNAAEPPSVLTSVAASVPTYHSIDPHFRAALDMQGGIGIDRQITKKITANVTYLYTQGVHQYLSNNITAPLFDEADYTVTGATPAVYNYQFQSGGFYRQNQLIFSSAVRAKSLTVSGNYTLNAARSDTQGVNSFPSVAQDPGFDYGRASFGIRHRLLLIESYTAPHGIVIASLLAAQSGTPYNLTIGSDLTENNQFNARPTYGTCGAAGVLTTQFGCLDTDPTGKDEPIVPFDIGTGPANALFTLRASKVVGIGPRLKTSGEGQSFTPDGGGVSGRGLSGGGPSIRLDAAAPRRYNLTFVAGANNLFNIVNRGTPNGVLLSPIFGKTQSLAGGQFGSPVPGNRSVILQSTFTF